MAIWIAATVAAVGLVTAAIVYGEAQKEVASTTADATKYAADKASHANIQQALAQERSDKFTEEQRLKADMAYIEADKFYYEQEMKEKDFGEQALREIDQIDVLWTEEGGWGSGGSYPQDYGGGDGCIEV